MIPRRVQRWAALVPSTIAASLAAIMLGAVWSQGHGTRHSSAAEQTGQKQLDPAAWGNDHVGQGLPMYMESGECLFCHREQVGATWPRNRHNLTIREGVADEPSLAALGANPATKALADEVQLLLGDTRAQRFLRRSPDYGKMELLTPVATFGRGTRARLVNEHDPHWDTETFATACAGCHTTAIDPATHAFAAVSLDCYACHGDATEEHANEPSLMPLAKARKDSPAAVISICGSCHLRDGKSKSSGLPYPNNFVAGDNLFKDFQVDFERADDEELNPADRHVLRNVRDVALLGRENMTCLTCHDVHKGSSDKHRNLPSEALCFDCHNRSEPIKGHQTYEVHSERCEY
ncbi:MAG: cytochrome c3 family protein [Pirellulales bacterium]